MKKLWATLLAALFSVCISSINADAQGNITTRKQRLSDFTIKTTKIVCTGNELFDLQFRDEVARFWRATPFEFCTAEEYEASKKNDSYYFLRVLDNKEKKASEPGVSMLVFSKGGSDDKNQDNHSFEIISIPFCTADEPSGREITYLSALIGLIQHYTLDSMNSDLNGLYGVGAIAKKNAKFNGKKFYFAGSDLTSGVTEDDLWQEKNAVIEEDDTVDERYNNCEPDGIVSYVVAPGKAEKGNACYLMLFTTDTHEICYFEKRALNGKNESGFNAADIKQILKQKKK